MGGIRTDCPVPADTPIHAYLTRLRRIVSNSTSLCRRGRRSGSSTSAPGSQIIEPIQQIDPTGKSLPIYRNRVKPLAKKYFCFPETKIELYNSHPVPLRGALRNVPTRGGDAVDVDGDLTRVPEAYVEVVWFRHPQAGVKFPGNRFPGGDGGKSAGLTEESTYKT